MKYDVAWLLALSLLATSACKKEPKPAPLSSTELRQRTEVARRELDELKPQFTALRERFTLLHREFDPLPPGLPNFGETRSKFYSADIGLGTLSAKLPWLTGRIDAANRTADGAELARVSAQIARTKGELRQIDRILVELSRDVQPFKHVLEEKLLLQAQGKNACE